MFAFDFQYVFECVIFFSWIMNDDWCYGLPTIIIDLLFCTGWVWLVFVSLFFMTISLDTPFMYYNFFCIYLSIRYSVNANLFYWFSVTANTQFHWQLGIDWLRCVRVSNTHDVSFAFMVDDDDIIWWTRKITIKNELLLSKLSSLFHNVKNWLDSI